MSKKGFILIVGAVLMSFLFIGTLAGCGGEVTEQAFIVDFNDVAKEVPFGTELNLNGIFIRVKLSNGTFIALNKGADGYSVDDGDYDKETPGVYKIKITYKDYDPVSFNIEVLKEVTIDENYNPDLVMTGIAVKPLVGKRLFAFGEDFSAEGIVIEKLMSDNTKSILDASQYTIDDDNFKSSKVGIYTIKVVYPPNIAFFDTYTVTVTPEIVPVLTSITILADDAKTEYRYGEVFNASGIVVEKNYITDNVMETELALPTEFTINLKTYDKEKLGKQNISISINDTDVVGTYEIEVIDFLQSISVDKSGAKTSFLKGETFGSYGLKVFTTMASGLSEQGDIADFTIDSSEFDSEATGIYTITVYFTENESILTSYEVNVIDGDI